MVFRMLGQMLCSYLVKVLRVADFPDKALVLQCTDSTRCAAQCKADLDALFGHNFFKIAVYSKRRPADTGLEGETVFEIRSSSDNLCNIFCHHQFPGIVGDAGFLCGDLCRIADGINHTDCINIYRRDAAWNIGERHERICNNHGMIGKFSIMHGKAHRTAVVFPAGSFCIAAVVRSGCCQKGDIDMHFPSFNSSRAAAVAADNSRILQLSA